MDIEISGGLADRGLVRAWTFRILLLVGAVACLLGPLIQFQDRQALADAVPAAITKATPYVKAPTFWSDSQQALFEVKVSPADGSDFFRLFYLRKHVVEHLMQGGTADIVDVKDNPGQHVLKGEPLPAIAWGWVIAGTLFLSVFDLAMNCAEGRHG